jgi:hypothetical protein
MGPNGTDLPVGAGGFERVLRRGRRWANRRTPPPGKRNFPPKCVPKLELRHEGRMGPNGKNGRVRLPRSVDGVGGIRWRGLEATERLTLRPPCSVRLKLRLLCSRRSAHGNALPRCAFATVQDLRWRAVHSLQSPLVIARGRDE